MKRIKSVLLFIFLTYSLLAVADYVAVRARGDQEYCTARMAHPTLLFHLLMPGAGNACIDMGLWP